MTNCSIGFKHYIITRFNVRADSWIADVTGRSVHSIDWLKNRLALFQHFCFPAMQQQSCLNFTWLVYFDSYTPKHIKQRIEGIFALCSPQQKFYPRYVDSEDAFFREITNLEQAKSDNEAYLITTRLDSDDSLHSNSVAKIQEEFATRYKQILQERGSVNKFAINFMYGFYLKPGERAFLLRVSHPSNPFISLVENVKPGKEIETVYKYAHTYFSQQSEMQLFQILDGRYYVWLLHDNNIATKTKECIRYGNVWPILNLQLLNRFHIDTSEIDLVYTEYILNILLVIYFSGLKILKHIVRQFT